RRLVDPVDLEAVDVRRREARELVDAEVAVQLRIVALVVEVERLLAELRISFEHDPRRVEADQLERAGADGPAGELGAVTLDRFAGHDGREALRERERELRERPGQAEL